MMPTKLVTCAVAMRADSFAKLDQLGNQLIARQVIEIDIAIDPSLIFGVEARVFVEVGKLSALAQPCRFDRGDVDLFHAHHRVERALGGRAIRVGHRCNEGARGDLP